MISFSSQDDFDEIAIHFTLDHLSLEFSSAS